MRVCGSEHVVPHAAPSHGSCASCVPFSSARGPQCTQTSGTLHAACVWSPAGGSYVHTVFHPHTKQTFLQTPQWTHPSSYPSPSLLPRPVPNGTGTLRLPSSTTACPREGSRPSVWWTHTASSRCSSPMVSWSRVRGATFTPHT